MIPYHHSGYEGDLAAARVAAAATSASLYPGNAGPYGYEGHYGQYHQGKAGVAGGGGAAVGPRIYFKMPRVVPNQRERFDTEDMFKKNAKEQEVRKDPIHKGNYFENLGRFKCIRR